VVGFALGITGISERFGARLAANLNLQALFRHYPRALQRHVAVHCCGSVLRIPLFNRPSAAEFLFWLDEALVLCMMKLKVKTATFALQVLYSASIVFHRVEKEFDKPISLLAGHGTDLWRHHKRNREVMGGEVERESRSKQRARVSCAPKAFRHPIRTHVREESLLSR